MVNRQQEQEISAFREDQISSMRDVSSGLSVGELFRIIQARRLIVILVLLFALSVSILYSIFGTREYEGIARLDIDPNRASASSLSDTLAQTLGDSQASTRVQTEMEILQSDTVLLEAAKTLDLAHRLPFSRLKSIRLNPPPAHSSDLSPTQNESILKALNERLKISVFPGTTLVEVRYESSDPRLASEIPNAIVEAYIENDMSTSTSGTERVAAWLSSEMRNLRDQAAQAQAKLAEFQEQNHVIGLDESQNILVDHIRLLNQQVADAEADRILKQSLFQVAQTHDPKLLANLSQSGTLQLLNSQLVNLEAERDQTASKFGPGYPKLKELDYQVEKVQSELNAESDNIYKRFQEDYLASKGSEDALRSNLSKQEQLFYRVDQGAAQFAMLRQDASSLRDLYSALEYKLKEAGITETLKSTMIRIVDNAQQPSIPTQPKVPLVITAGLFLGLFGGVGLALAVDSIDDTIRTTVDVESQIGLPVLATVPHISASEMKGQVTGKVGPAPGAPSLPMMPVLTGGEGGAVEGFRQLRSSIHLRCLDEPPRITLISSSHANEGKSLASCNYAIMLAQRGLKVLLIDCDLRRGRVAARFRIRSSPGLTDMLSGSLQAANIPRPLPQLPDLAVLATGSRAPDPAEILSSKRMSTFLADSLQEFDQIVIDSAPILPVADTHSLAAQADVVVLVVRAGVTKKHAVKRSKLLCGRMRANLIGVLLNDVDMRIESYYTYGGGSYKYDYSGQEEKGHE